MNRKRGAPVLIELITRPNGPSVGGTPVPPYPSEANGRGGNPVSDPANWGPASTRTGSGAGGSEWRPLALLIGAGIVVVVIAALIGYQLGQKREKQDWAEKNAGTPPATAGSGGAAGGGAGAKVHDPLTDTAPPVVDDPSAALGGGVNRNGAPSAPAPPQVLALQDGWNYLVVASLRRSEAEQAATFLKDNGIAIQLVPAPGSKGKVDQGSDGANNALWQLWVLDGVPSSEYSQRRTQREALETKVKLLGRMWKAQNRKAPTDFSSQFWQKYKA